MNKTILCLIAFVIGFLCSVVLMSFYLSQLNENTITFQTDSVWFNECYGNESYEFVFTFGTLDCKDLKLNYANAEKKNGK